MRSVSINAARPRFAYLVSCRNAMIWCHLLLVAFYPDPPRRRSARRSTPCAFSPQIWSRRQTAGTPAPRVSMQGRESLLATAHRTSPCLVLAVGCAPMAHLLWSKVMKYNPANPKWCARRASDGAGAESPPITPLPSGRRATASCSRTGTHARSSIACCTCVACAGLFVGGEPIHRPMHPHRVQVSGYDLPLSELKRFRQLDSITAGHPENVLHPAIEVSTGPLGQGISNAVGMAIAEAHLAAEFNREGFPVIDSHTFVICGDGCLQEGISSEASSLAGHLGLGRLIVLYDDNHITSACGGAGGRRLPSPPPSFSAPPAQSTARRTSRSRRTSSSATTRTGGTRSTSPTATRTLTASSPRSSAPRPSRVRRQQPRGRRRIFGVHPPSPPPTSPPSPQTARRLSR